jgi:hypothetical protein
MGVGRLGREISAESGIVAIVVVSWLNKCSLNANLDIVPFFLQLLMAWLESIVAAAGCNCGPQPGRGCQQAGFDLCSQGYNFLMKLFILFAKDILIIFNLL